MSGLGPLVGALLGIGGAAAGFAHERRRRKRQGLPVDLRSLLSLEPGSFGRDSVERRVMIDAAALSFVVAAVCVIHYSFAAAIWDLPDPPPYVLGGLTGVIFGAACAAVGRRRLS